MCILLSTAELRDATHIKNVYFVEHLIHIFLILMLIASPFIVFCLLNHARNVAEAKQKKKKEQAQQAKQNKKEQSVNQQQPQINLQPPRQGGYITYNNKVITQQNQQSHK